MAASTLSSPAAAAHTATPELIPHWIGGQAVAGAGARLAVLNPATGATLREIALGTRSLAMTDCWVNIMGRGALHGPHLHPHSTLSGVYYVAVPAGAPGLKFEDPRFERFMAAPPRARDASRRNRPWVTIPARTGQLLLFESWLRHEVPANRDARERVSISFNYNWF